MRVPLQARFIRADVCDRGCPMVVFCDEHENVIATAHVEPQNIEPFILQLREAADVAAAKRRPTN